VHRGGVGRGEAQDRLDDARHLVQLHAELVVGLGIAQRMARKLAPVLVVVVPLRQIIAAFHATCG
jgi:hypothetical protein